MTLRVWYFGADWCKACHEKRPLVEQVCKEYGVHFIYADIENEHAKQTARDIGVRSIPYLVVQDFPDPEPAGCCDFDFSCVCKPVSEMSREELGIVYSAVGNMINRQALEARLQHGTGTQSS